MQKSVQQNEMRGVLYFRIIGTQTWKLWSGKQKSSGDGDGRNTEKILGSTHAEGV